MRNPLRYRVWYTFRQRVVTTIVVAAIVIGGGWYGVDRLTDRSCGPHGVAKPKGSDECIGVSGDGYDFGMRGLTAVAKAIGEENAGLKTAEDKPVVYATVAVLLPLTTRDEGMGTKVLHELQGAFAAQYRANHSLTGETPKIRLVLANTGSDNAFAPDVARQLTTMTGAPDNLRAVTGVATSNEQVERAVATLTGKDIAVVGTTITADNIANGPGGERFPGLARVSPTNQDEASALAQLPTVDPTKAVLVYGEGTKDRYTDTLRSAFEQRLRGKALYESKSFTAPADPTQEGDLNSRFRDITMLVCGMKQVNTVFFAGRHTQLRQFVNALGERGCYQDQPLTVVTGDEGSYLGADEKLDRTALTHNLTVQYAALAHPDAWVAKPGRPVPATGGSAADFRNFLDALTAVGKAPGGRVGPFAHKDLLDGQVIVAYDAMTTAVQGIWQAPPGDKGMPPIADVGKQWSVMQGVLKVKGAGGWICFDKYGNPYDKAIPVVRLTAKGIPEFVRIVWPKRSAPPPNCTP
ncbi:ABC transporter substrate-binding protein [Streptomyces sp. DT24]|uniref:ABC transporter substrate-binding protein n=1 Tax=unclassified Streptomyces TaxID=2593676 RepID=UPI0023B93E2B|nr:hypothetical protein [Streptomyces sp. AM 4-1-1]WEH34040.1 hypothetical protein PZB75_12070 [Streptomyces sp. AM 4-1-1]